MTERREYYAASVDEAVARAARELGLERDALTYRVVDEGNSGFLGIGARDARIEVVSAPFANPSEPTDPASTALEPAAGTNVESNLSELSEDRSMPADVDTVSDEEALELPQDAVDETEERVVALLDAMGFDARVDVYDAGGFVAVDVAPDNTALFIGQKGETIDALQYLVNAGINKARETRVRVVLDAEGYRQRRVEALQGMAHRTARKALREDRVVELPPMNPAERRVVHLFLRDYPRVTTESEGTGDDRRVRVSPA